MVRKLHLTRENKMTTQNFLVEIGTEELPPKALKTLATSFADNVEAELNQAGLSFDKIEWFAAPRRLAVKVLNLATQQPSKEIEKRGPAVSAAFDAEGKPTKAAEGWARGCGITVDQAERIATDKGEWLVHRAKIEGQPTKNLLSGECSFVVLDPPPLFEQWGWTKPPTLLESVCEKAETLLFCSMIEAVEDGAEASNLK